MWDKRAAYVTPNGAQTLSKRSQAFPGNYPSHLDYGRGAYVTDMEGRRYLDFIGGLGAVSLGYADGPVNAYVSRQLQRGTSFSLPHWMEVEVAEQLIDIIPCAEQVRFVKTGSEACAGVVRMARMQTGRETILTMGYHGWHDWYASTKDLHPGVPSGYSIYQKHCPSESIQQLEQRFDQHGPVAAVILEPALAEPPNRHAGRAEYLQQVIDVCHNHGALCIFDEMLCGFRWATAGGQEYFDVIPDLAVFGKGMANGFPLACIVGPRCFMNNAWPVSGTFGGEAVSLAACSATLKTYELKTYDSSSVTSHMWKLGKKLTSDFNALALSMGVAIECTGWPVHPILQFNYDHDRPNKSTIFQNRVATFFYQELIERGILMHPQGNNIIYAMTEEDINHTIDSIEDVFCVLKRVLDNGILEQSLKGPCIAAHPLGRMVTK